MMMPSKVRERRFMGSFKRFVRAVREDAGALWILALVFLAGLLNAAGFLRFGQTLSHMTGNLTKMGLALTSAEAEPVLLFLLFILSFFAGATLSGFSFPVHRTGLWRRSGLVLLGCGVLLLMIQAFKAPLALSLAAIALVLGAQNGLAVRYRGILTRTTHMTGHLTDCGAALGRMIAGKSFRGENLRLFLFHLACLVCFALGAAFCALLSPILPMDILMLAGLCYALAGLGTLLRALVYGEGRQGQNPSA